MTLTGNKIVITGGTSGIGLGLAEAFVARGNQVIVCGRRVDRLEAMAQRHPQLITRVCDVADESSRRELIRWIIDHHSDVNVLVNNAGVQFASAVGSGMNLTQVRQEIETNIFAVLELSDQLVPVLAGKPGATILNVSSGLAFVPIAFMTVYCATKAFVHSATLSMRHTLKSQGVEVVEVIPPSVDTELGKERRSDPKQTHGGMPLDEFISGVFTGLEAGHPEIAVGPAVALRTQGEALFQGMNSR